MKKIIQGIEIRAVAAYVPEKIFNMRSLMDVYDEKTVENMIKTTGVERVHIAGENETTSDMCYNAAQKLLESINLNRDNIDAIVFVSQTFDYLYPATSVVLQHRLKLPEETICFDISYGCSGYIYGLLQASCLISSGVCNNVLLLVGDTNSKIINPSNLGARMVFGDAGAATLISRGDGYIGFQLGSKGDGYETIINQTSGFRNWPQNTNKLDYSKNANNGDDVFAFIVSKGTRSIKEVAGLMTWNMSDIDFFALHQATKFSVDYLKKKLRIPELKAPFNIGHYGNSGPATVPLLLCDMANSEIWYNKTDKWQKAILAAYGVGLSWGSVACDMSKTVFLKPINQDI